MELTVFHRLGHRILESWHGGGKWSSALVIFQQQEVVWGATLQRESTKLSLFLILSRSWPVEFDVGFHFRVKGPCRSGEESTVGSRIFSFDALASHFLGRVLFLHKGRSSVGSWTGHPLLLNLSGAEGRELSLSSSECANIGLPVFLSEGLIEVLSGVLIWTRVSIATEQ